MRSVTIVVLIALSISSFGQTIRRVNNNPGVSGTNIYSTIQLAHDASTDGDIIYVEGSSNSYGTLTSTKSLTWVGPGYLLAKTDYYGNWRLHLQATELNAYVGTMTLNAG